jgi:Ni/Fe-hydrogenase 1 B-type cytochrome subunit
MATIAQPNAPPANLDPIERRRYVWEFPVRLSHWVNAIAIGVLFLTGLFIASPVAAPNGEAYNHFLMGKIRLLHFAFAYALLVGIAIRVYWFFAGNNYARSGFPFFWRSSGRWWSIRTWSAGTSISGTTR